jgi:hypothetical protein
MTRCKAAGALAALLLAAGCASQPDHGGAPPRPTAIEPASGYPGAALDVVIRGDGFALRAYQDAGSPRLASTFRAWVGGVELADVAWASAGELRATLPAGLSPGLYDVAVEDPYGRRGSLPGGFRVLIGTPPSLSARAEVNPHVVLEGQPLAVQVIVRNDGGSPALAVVPEFLVTGAGGVASAQAPAPRALDPQTATTFTVPFTATAAGAVRLDVAIVAFDPSLGVTIRTDPQLAGTLTVVTGGATLLASGPGIVESKVDELVTIDVVYANNAGEGVIGLAPKVSSVAGAVQILQAPPPCDVAVGATCTASFVVAAGSVGDSILVVDAAGTTVSGLAVAAPSVSVRLHAVSPVLLSGRLIATPGVVLVGQPITVMLEVTNLGDVAALNVTGRMLAAPVGAEPGPDPAPQAIPPGATAALVWSVVPSRAGTGAFVAAASGFDTRGWAISVAPVASGSVEVE